MENLRMISLNHESEAITNKTHFVCLLEKFLCLIILANYHAHENHITHTHRLIILVFIVKIKTRIFTKKKKKKERLECLASRHNEVGL